jgi:hypothetical protein
MRFCFNFMYGVSGRFKEHVSLDFGYDWTTANFFIYPLWYLQKNGHLKSTDIVNVYPQAINRMYRDENKIASA